jgi:hypothetical protein
MSERSNEPESDPAESTGLAGGSAADPASSTDRRSFLRQLSTDAVWTAGKVAGASAAFRRSLVSAGESAIGTFEAVEEPMAVAARPTDAALASEPRQRDEPASATPSTSTGPDPVAALTAAQQAFLVDAASAVLAVNDPAGHPMLAPSEFHWDGAVIRLPARDFTARTIDIDRDPKVALLIDDPASEAWVAINGVASLVYGERVDPEMRLILSKYHDADDVTRRWEQLRSAGDQVVILIRPTRFVWRSG